MNIHIKSQKAFTLIELMIVVAIIGILAAIAVPQYQTFIGKSQVSRAVSETAAIKAAVEDCMNHGKTVIGDFPNCDPQATGSSILVGASQTSYTLSAGTGVPEVTNPLVTAVGTVNTITGTLGGSASAALTGSTVTWTRTRNGVWSCASTAQPKYNTTSCPSL